MTADVELLPCPWCGEKLASVSVSEGSTPRWRKVDGCCADGPEVRHDTMADDQEAAEVESRAAAIAAWNTRACVAHATAAQAAEIEALRAEVERLTSEVRCLRQQYDERTACMIVHRGSALACSAAVRAAYSDEHRRAERLAEALRHLRNHTSVNSHQIELIDTALNPTAAQEGKESFWPKLPGSGGPDWTGHD